MSASHRNTLAIVDWPTRAPVCIAWLREEVPKRIRLHGVLDECAAANGIRPTYLLGLYLRRADSETWKDIKRTLGTGKPAAPAPEPVEHVDPIEAERARLEQRLAVKEEREAIREVAGERSLRSKLERLFVEVAPRFAPPPPYKARALSMADVVEETLHLTLSDFHGGEIVRAEATRGLNSYDWPTLCRRSYRVVDRALSIVTRLERGGYRFPRLIVAANGDFVSGTIHELERHTDGQNIVTVVHGVGMLFAAMLRDLAARFPVVDVFCISGNHGRLPDARKMQSKDPLRNWDAVIYLFAKAALADVPNVIMHIPDAYAVAYEAEGMTILQQHGHDVPPGALSIPLYGIDRQVRNINALEAQRGGAIDLFVYSHFHNKSMTDHSGSEVIVNGSLIGGTEWTINRLGKCDRPSQWLLGLHKEQGISHRWPIYANAPSDAPRYPIESTVGDMAA